MLAHHQWWRRLNDPKDADEKKWQMARGLIISPVCVGRTSAEDDLCVSQWADIFDYIENKQLHTERYVIRGKST